VESVYKHDSLAERMSISFADLDYAVAITPDVRIERVNLTPKARQADTPLEGVAESGGFEAFLLSPQWIAYGKRAADLGASTEWDFECEHPTQDGQRVWLHHRCIVCRREDGSTVIVGAARDVTVHKAELERLAQSENLYRQVAENSSDFVMRTSPNRIIEYVSESVKGVLGWTPDELVGQQISHLIHPDDQAVAREFSRQLNAGEAVFLQTRFRTRSGRYIWMAQHVKPILSDTGEVIARAGVWRDVTGEVVAQKALAESEERFRLAMRSAPAGVALIGPGREFLAVNPALCRILQQDERWLLSRGMADILHAEDDAIEQSLHVASQGLGEEPPTAELRCIRADGVSVWVRESVGTLRAGNGEETSVAHFVDISEARAAAERLQYLAQHDELTGQLRPAALHARLEDLLRQQAEQPVGQLIVMFVDVDGLKAVNDSLGHEAGDEVIRVAAQRIAASVRASDVVARIGGDEFVVVLGAVRELSDALTVAEKLQKHFGRPIAVHDHELRMSLSIGISVAEPTDGVDDVLRRADLALYASKRSGRARATVFSDELDSN
jgi:diguanylate cyclase (GGDEF)-like protein/PAS domain S-box-containing protein